jgi:hypothetical protein
VRTADRFPTFSKPRKACRTPGRAVSLCIQIVLFTLSDGVKPIRRQVGPNFHYSVWPKDLNFIDVVLAAEIKVNTEIILGNPNDQRCINRAQVASSVITSKAANGYHFKTGQRDWPSRTENVLSCRLLWWQVGFGTPASRARI